jgi:hypothetical protein
MRPARYYHSCYVAVDPIHDTCPGPVGLKHCEGMLGHVGVELPLAQGACDGSEVSVSEDAVRRPRKTLQPVLHNLWFTQRLALRQSRQPLRHNLAVHT